MQMQPVKKSEIDMAVAAELGIPAREVAVISTALFNEIKNALISRGTVNLSGLGKLSLKFCLGSSNTLASDKTNPMAVRINFRKSSSFRQQIQHHYHISQGRYERPGNEQVRSG